MNGAYFDLSYLAKLHWREPGTAEVLAVAGRVPSVACSIHGRVEFAAVGHRKVREMSADLEQARANFAQILQDGMSGGIHWLTLEETILQRAEAVFLSDRGSVFLRASDALHLACAAAHGFREIYSNDRHLLAAAPLFGLRGVNIIVPQES